MRRFLNKFASDRVIVLTTYTADHTQAASARSSYSIIHNFCVASILSHSTKSQRYHAPLLAPSSCAPVIPIRRLASPTFPPTVKYRVLEAAEQEWLQEEAYSSSEYLEATTPTPRFDWRLRATSRVPVLPAGENCKLRTRQSYVKRVQPPCTNVQMGEPFFEEIQSYQARFLALLAAEQAEEETILKERLSTWTLGRLKEEGYCLTHLHAFWLQANQFGRPVAAFLLGPGQALPEHRFENGIQVFISRLDPLQEQPMLGSVVARTTTQIKVSFQECFTLEGPWRLDIGFSNIIYERMRTAISHLNHDPRIQEFSPFVSDRQIILQGTHLRDVILRTFSKSTASTESPLRKSDGVNYLPREALGRGSRTISDIGGAFRDDLRIMSWAKRYREVEPIRVEGDPVLSPLNATQIKAIAMMIGERISLVQGPPGTGKTKTIVEAVKLLKIHFQVPHPILVCTYTNVAVDNLVESLSFSGVRPLRVGYGGKVKSSLLEHTLDYKLEIHPLRPEVDQLTKKDEGLQKRMNTLRTKLEELRKTESVEPQGRLEKLQTTLIGMEKQHGALKSRIYAIRQKMLRQVVGNADVVCTTCITSACVALNVTDFPVVFLDEASMSTEPASLIPIMKGSRHVALIGDHKQLPPVITSRKAQQMGLGVSLFERLTEEGVVPSIMLDVQYRMHPAISRFPSSEFYNFSLHDGTVDSVGNIPSRLQPPTSRHLLLNAVTGTLPSIVFLDHAGSESVKDRSRVNHNEAHILCSIIEDLLLCNEGLRGQDIGIIAPYVAQISLITRLLTADAKYSQRFKAVLGDHRMMQIANIEIKTVDGFEGREKEVMIFSTVRNNAGGHIGFLADRRRLNVGLTRAKRGLFVLGSINTLMAGKQPAARVGKGAESWRRYAQFLREEGLVRQLDGEKLRVALYGSVVDRSVDSGSPGRSILK